MTKLLGAMILAGVFTAYVSTLENRDPTDHLTVFEDGQKVEQPHGCEWVVTIKPGADQSPVVDPDGVWGLHASGMPCVADSYSHCTADEQQIWGYCWAHDACAGAMSAVANCAVSTGTMEVKRTRACSNPQPVMNLDWKPKFEARAELSSTSGEAAVAGQMSGECTGFEDAKVNVSGGVGQTTQQGGTMSMGVTAPGGAGISLSLTPQYGAGATEQPFSTYLVRAKTGLTEATAGYTGAVAVRAWADTWGVDGDGATAQGYIWESKMGFDLFGHCDNPACLARSWVTHSWY